MSRIGIFSGTFDPIHGGHISFALKAIQAARLDRVVFLPERLPRRKRGITHYGHRVAMLKGALVAHQKLDVLELPDPTFTVAKTLPRLNKTFAGDQVFLLLGSDNVYGLKKWPHVATLLRSYSLIVGMRSTDHELTINEHIKMLSVEPPETFVLLSPAPQISSSTIRDALTNHTHADGLLSSVKKYSKQHWLYASANTKGAHNSG